LKPVESSVHESSTISNNNNTAPTAKWVKKEETNNYPNSISTAYSINNTGSNTPISSSFPSSTSTAANSTKTNNITSPIATSLVSPKTYMNLPVADDINQVRVESHEKPNNDILADGLRQRTNINVGL